MKMTGKCFHADCCPMHRLDPKTGHDVCSGRLASDSPCECPCHYGATPAPRSNTRRLTRLEELAHKAKAERDGIDRFGQLLLW